MIGQEHFIAVVGTFLIGCAVLLVVGGSGVQAEATEEQGHSDRCGGTRFIVVGGARYTTNDVPGCPSGGLLSATARQTLLRGEKGDDEVRGLGGSDELYGGLGSDVIYAGPGDDFLEGEEDDDVLYGGDGGDILVLGGRGDDVLYGGDGNDYLDGRDDGVKDQQRDELYCGGGRDEYSADKVDYVSSSCEMKYP